MLITIGRDASCNFVIDSPRVSGSHCQIRFFADRFEVTDLGSSNGTFVGAERTRVQAPTTVFPGQPLFLGTMEISPSEVAGRMGLQWPAAAPAAAPARPVGSAAATVFESGRLPHAGFWIRFAASLIDYIVMTVVGFVLEKAAMPSGDPTLAVLIFLFLVYAFFCWIYWAAMESSPQQGTFGKMALGLKVTDMNGNRIGFGSATLRFLGMFVSTIICGAGYIMAAFTEKKQTLHDIMAGCLVLEKR